MSDYQNLIRTPASIFLDEENSIYENLGSTNTFELIE